MMNWLPIFSFGTAPDDVLVLDVPGGRFRLDRRSSVIVVNRPPARPDGTIRVEPLARECFEQLKPGGLLYLRLDNWFWSSPFTSRFVRRLMKLIGRQVPPAAGTLVQSYWAVERILKKSGFDRIQCFALLPYGDAPTHLVPLDRKNVVKFFLMNVPWSRTATDWCKKALFRAAARLGLLPYLIPSYCVVAEKVAL